MTESFFSNKSPTLYTLPHNVSFVDELACAVLEMFSENPLNMVDLTIYLPNRRSVRELEKSILRKTDGKPTLLPSLIAIGDLSEDEQALNSHLGQSSLETKITNPPIPELSRLLLLTNNILKVSKHLGLGDLNPSEGVGLAKTLCQLLDQVQNEGVSFDGLKKLAPEELAGHWQKVLTFLEIISEHWPKILEEEGFCDPVVYRNQQIDLLTEHLSNNQSSKPIIAAGSTGSNPSTARLLRAIANQQLGAVVLPGFDSELDEKTRDAIGSNPTHPQFSMHKLLELMQVNANQVDKWPFKLSNETKAKDTAERMRFLKEALRPAETVDSWQNIRFDAKTFMHNMSYVTCPSPREEAGVVALIMRQALEDDDKTIALVTPDRTLANRVGTELARWDIEVDDSAGTPLFTCPSATFISLLAQAAEQNFSPTSTLSLLKHPFAANGLVRVEFLSLVRKLEKEVLRGQKPAAGLKGIKSAIKQHKDFAKLKDIFNFVNHIEQNLLPLIESFKKDKFTFKHFLQTLITTAQTLASNDEKQGEDVLWSGNDGHNLSRFFSDLLIASSYLDDISTEQAPALLDATLKGKSITKAYGTHPRISIWGTLEARLKHADIMILSGLNEGSWPPQIMDDPWMSRPMKAKMKLPPAEKKIGQSALDFLGAAGGENVIITRAEKSEGAPTVPSRWLLRMEALAGLPKKGDLWLPWFQVLDRPENVTPTQPPRPTPPVEARPKAFSVSAVQNWMSDPYSIYAQYILNLKPLDPLEAEPDAALRGTVIHEAFETFMDEKSGKFIKGDLKALLQHGEKAFEKFLPQSSVIAFWWPRFEKAAEAFIEIQISRENKYSTIGNEIWGRTKIESSAGEFEIYGKADRIDLNLSDNTLDIIDYKTGSVPSTKQIIAGFKPQLPMLGLMATQGGLEDVEQTQVGSFAYWTVGSGNPPVKINNLSKLDVNEEIDRTKSGLQALFVDFQNQDTAYLSNPRPTIVGYGTYDHLARVKEWKDEEYTEEVSK